MSRPSLPTPCPTGLRRTSIDNATDENTENIEYTRAFLPVQPRRKSMMLSKPASKALPKRANNLEDLREEEELNLCQQRRRPEMKKTLLGKPAQRIATRKQDVLKPETDTTPQDKMRGNRRASGIYGDSQARDMRRRTMFIPDDTTMLTIHPGTNITHRLDDTFQIGLADLTSNPVGSGGAIKQPMRRPRKSLAAAPKRIPLGQMQNNAMGLAYDGPGVDTGKENESPERASASVEKRIAKAPLGDSRSVAPHQHVASRKSFVPRHAIAPHQPIGSALIPTFQASRPRACGKPGLVITRKSASPPTIKLSGISDRLEAIPTCKQAAPHSKPSLRRVHPVVPRRSIARTTSVSVKDTILTRRSEMQATKIDKYPVFSNNLAHPELYEDRWLSHQEVALTHIVNEIFSRAGIDKHGSPESQESLRGSMIILYDHPSVVELHQHLHASVQFGSLRPSPPSEFSPDVSKDIGLRKRFINLFVKNYEECSLRAAVEVIVGRQMPPPARRSVDSEVKQGESIMDPHANKRILNGFLETFFIDCADIEHDIAELSREKKALQRSLMLVWLLDRARTAGVISSLLFKTSAPFKSSIAIVQELGRILLSATPDVFKPLKLMGLNITHVQCPIDEVVYHVHNLAADLRDGILISKLVSLALESPYQPACDDLKVPCFGHASKIHNVQIALTALQTADLRAGIVPLDVTPADIVDGHREKTLMLIWHIVSQYGLSRLVDWRELCADIRRAGGDIDTPTGAFSGEDQEVLLQSWAAVHAVKHNVQVSNLTTSFAAGEVYSAILSAFTTTSGTLERKLQCLGFPTAWTKHLFSTFFTVPNKTTTLSNLAFLASRLLPLSRRARAASTIQRAFLAKRDQKVLSQRIALMRIARDCATVVKAQQQIVGAAVILQRAWRDVIARRIGRLERNVVIFQVAAREWLTGRNEEKGRLMGGW